MISIVKSLGAVIVEAFRPGGPMSERYYHIGGKPVPGSSITAKLYADRGTVAHHRDTGQDVTNEYKQGGYRMPDYIAKFGNGADKKT
jgi:hypothetical protein